MPLSVAAVRAASATPKHTVAMAQPTYGVSRDDEQPDASSCKGRPLQKQKSFAVLKKIGGAHFKLGLVAVLFALAYAVETKAVLNLESSQDLFEVRR